MLKTSLHCNLLSSYPQSSMTTEGQPMDSGYTLMKSNIIASLLPDTECSQLRQQIGRLDGIHRTSTRHHHHQRSRSHRNKQQQKLKRRVGAGYEIGLNTSATILAATLAMWLHKWALNLFAKCKSHYSRIGAVLSVRSLIICINPENPFRWTLTQET